MTSAKKLPLGAAMKKYRNQYLMVAPFAIVFILFTVLPVAAAIFMIMDRDSTKGGETTGSMETT